MQLRSRIGSVCCCVQSRPIGATWKHFTTSSSMSSAEVRNCIDKECEDFLPWLEKKAGVGISSHLTVGKSSYGRCLVASKSIMEGECMLKVPFSVQITEDNMRPEILSMLGDEVGNVTRLALLILIEQKMGEGSEWAPYIRHLPRPGEMHNAVLWSDRELQMVRQSSMFLETAKLKAQLEKDFMHIKRVFQHLPEVFEDVSFHDFIHAYTLVTSRAWERQNCPSLIPFADFVNHDGSSEADLLGDIDKQCSEVIADRDYIAGEQVLIRYGKFSNATLLFDFGFTHPNNVYDQVCIELCIPAWDPLRSKKIELLQKHCTPAIRDINGFNSSWNSFTIKEVRLNSKIGRGIPQSLRAFARVLCSSSLEEIEDLEMEATNNDGRLARLPLKDASKEFQAHQLLIACIRQHIEDYDESIKRRHQAAIGLGDNGERDQDERERN
uniref:SET domain-containing protein n=2 Tax=Kalanchoe fedtschenkoi TaxID=63787 RepID=A0A7N0UCS9_KALFE